MKFKVESDLENKETFDLVPALYDEIRPGYPLLVLEEIERYAGLNSSSRIIEVGCGTGQASKYFIDKNYSFLGIDLGAGLISFSGNKFADRPNASFIHCSFEELDREQGKFDLLLAAQSFHWIEPNFGINKAAEMLCSGGAVALLWNLDESQGTEFWHRSSPIHEKYMATVKGKEGADLKERVQRFFETLSSSLYFEDVQMKQSCWNKEYSAEEWTKMRNTFSPDLQMEKSSREAFHSELAEIINGLGGKMTRFYRTVCILGHRRQ